MRRTQVYLTDEQRRRIEARSKDAGVSQGEIIRRVLDDGLGIDNGVDDALAAVRATAGILKDAPDWPEWLAEVRGRGADARLRELDR